MKNDHTYEYRVFTNRLVDVGPMEVGNCTSKVIENLKSKDKVDGRFFHTSDTNKWFFCWNGELQELNLSGDADINEALKEVKKLIGEAKDAADAATKAAEDANAAVESIKGKADQDYVDDKIATVNSTATEAKATADAAAKDAAKAAEDANAAVGKIANKADRTAVDDLSQIVYTKANATDVQELSDKVNAINLDDYVSKAEIPPIDDLATKQEVAAAGAVAEANAIADANSYTDSKSAEVLNAAKAHSEKLTNIYDAAGAAITAKNEAISYADAKFQEKGDYALKTEIPPIDDLATKQDVADAKDWVSQQGFLTEETLKNSTVISDINSQISKINTLLGDVKSYITDTILAEYYG